MFLARNSDDQSTSLSWVLTAIRVRIASDTSIHNILKDINYSLSCRFFNLDKSLVGYSAYKFNDESAQNLKVEDFRYHIVNRGDICVENYTTC